LPVSPPRKRTKTSSSTPNLKSPSIMAPSLLKNLFQFQNIYILSNGFSHLFGVEDPVKMSLSFFGPDINRVKRPPNNFNLVSWLMRILNLVYCYSFLFASLAVIQAIYIEMVCCKELMSVPLLSFPWILASPESGQSISVLCL
jgi:hypothetical protein